MHACMHGVATDLLEDEIPSFGVGLDGPRQDERLNHDVPCENPPGRYDRTNMGDTNGARGVGKVEARNTAN